MYLTETDSSKIGETGPFWPEQHYEIALVHMDAVLSLSDTRSVTYLLLMAMFCLRGKDPTAWTLAGLAVRLCIELGLHRKACDNKVTMKKELDVRLFWACYYLDREMSVALGETVLVYGCGAHSNILHQLAHQPSQIMIWMLQFVIPI